MYDDLPRRTPAPDRARTPMRAMMATSLVAFLGGAALIWALAADGRLPGWHLRGDERAVAGPAEGHLPVAAPSASSSAAVEAHQAAQKVAQVAQVQGGLDQRVAGMEQRITRLDLQAQAAAGNASRAEGLLIAFAARRALERGARLGYLEDQLRLRFADSRPNAVQTVVDAANDPVTLDQLVTRLGQLSPDLARRPGAQGMLSWLSRELSQIFVVRRADAPSPATANRIERARLFLRTGRADLAADEIRRLPNSGSAGDWIADADRYAKAERALDLLEMTAIEAPRELRDGAGKPVEQASPVG
ncbi:MAG: hypothetical protein ABIT09_11220 [Croceibacterium sp.]